MAFAAGDDVEARQDRLEVEVARNRVGLQRQDRHVERAVPQPLDQLDRIAVGLVDAHVGMGLLEPRDHRRDDAVHEDGRAADPHDAGMPGAVAFDDVRRDAVGLQHRPPVFGKGKTEVGGLQRSPPRFEQRLADPRLELRQGARDRGLRLSQRLGPFGQTAVVDDRGKDLEMAGIEFHNVTLY